MSEPDGAVKVDAFPPRTKYPFRDIADDGGVWRLDPACYGAKVKSIRTNAGLWATRHGMRLVSMADSGFIYVQFVPEVTA